MGLTKKTRKSWRYFKVMPTSFLATLWYSQPTDFEPSKFWIGRVREGKPKQKMHAFKLSVWAPGRLSDLPFHNYRTSKSVDRYFWPTWISSIDGFWGSKIVKGSVSRSVGWVCVSSEQTVCSADADHQNSCISHVHSSIKVYLFLIQPPQLLFLLPLLLVCNPRTDFWLLQYYVPTDASQSVCQLGFRLISYSVSIISLAADLSLPNPWSKCPLRAAKN